MAKDVALALDAFKGSKIFSAGGGEKTANTAKFLSQAGFYRERPGRIATECGRPYQACISAMRSAHLVNPQKISIYIKELGEKFGPKKFKVKREKFKVS